MNKIAFLSNIVTNPLDKYFEGFECFHYEINNIAQILTNRVDSDFLVILLDIDYFSFDGFLTKKSTQKLEELNELLIFFRKNNKTKIIVSNISTSYIDINTNFNIIEYQKLLGFNLKINRLAEISDTAILNIYHLVLIYGYNNFINLKNGFLFQAPWTKLAYSVVAESINEKLQLFQISRKKVLILDADNTLWGGVVGERGAANIDIDENYPGVVFRHFQQQLKHLQKSGILLALASKNNLTDVQEVFKKRDMPLKWNDFVVKKINWRPKSENIKEIVNQLNLGLESAVFIDDSSFEISEVESVLDIETIQLSIDSPVENLSKFNQFPPIKALNITSEDKVKNSQYKIQKKRDKHKVNFKSIDSYLSSIDMNIKMSINDQSKVKRITQLINKTNQFNLTTKRYSESEVLFFMNESQVFSFNLSDQFGDLGLVAVVILVENNIDSFLISCRALGRNLEYKILYLVARNVGGNFYSSYIETKKNSQVSNFYDKFSLSIDRNEFSARYSIDFKSIFDVKYIKEEQ
jgi:FkbH-like protein